MTSSGIAAATPQQPSNQLSQTSGHHKHHGHKMMSLSDVDAQSSSLGSAQSSTGGVGSKVNITV